MGAFNNDELRGSHYAMASVGYVHELARIFEGALGRVYLGGWVESGNAFEEWKGVRFETNVSAGLMIETPLGPGFLTASLGEGGRHRFYVGIGPVFDK
jgi:outer membrane translocation and assembly module TamA